MTKKRPAKYHLWLWWSIFTVTMIIAFTIVVGGLVRNVRNYYLTFLRVADISQTQLIETVKQALNDRVELSRKQELVFLILGTDTLDWRPGDKVMTDTIMLATVDLARRQLSFLSLPRDIYLPERAAKINTLYNTALVAGSPYPERAVASYLSQWLNVPIDGTFVFTLDQVQSLIDIMGGVEVEVKRSFSDPLYPRSGVDVTWERDPAILYETVNFTAGKTLMNGETALKFMRSRHASGVEGSDLARAERQQLVIDAFIARAQKQILDERTFFNFIILGNLYRFYNTYYERYLPLHLALAMAIQAGTLDFSQSSPGIVQNILSVYPQNPEGVLEEATPEEMVRFYNGAWVWKIRDLAALKAEVRRDLRLDLVE